MKVINIIRPLNIIMLVFYMMLFYWTVITPLHEFTGTEPTLAGWQYGLLVLSTILIAAGGYVINDYFDVPIDLYNKPDKMIVTRFISEEKAFNLYLTLTAIGILSALAVAFTLGRITLIFYQILPAVMLWIYAQSYKKTFLIGNILVSFLSGLVIMVPAMYEINLKTLGHKVENAFFINALLKISIAYALFAFISTLIREIIKDIEDMEGDKRCDARTIPIKLGINPTKGILAFLYLILLTGISFFLPQLYKANEVIPFMYIILLLIIPIIYMLFLLLKAVSKDDFGRLSFTLKVFMLSGMVTMIYFFINYAA